MVEATLLPVPSNAQELTRFEFDTSIKSKTYNFQFRRNSAGDFWVVSIRRTDTDEPIFHTKVVIGLKYAFQNEGWGFIFHDFTLTETAVTGANLANPVRAALFDVEP